LTTGFGVISNDAQLKIGESAVIIGCGGIGLGVVLGAKQAGACPVIAVDLYEPKLETAARYGATHTINATKDDFVARAKNILNGLPADVVVDGTGNASILEKALELAGPQGRVVGVGVMPHDRKVSLNTLQFHMGKSLRGSHGGDSRPAEDIPRILRMIKAGRFETNGFVSHRTRLPDINSAIEKMRSGESIHTIIQFDPPA
jgi:Zn-dependent alcohol dehydrogenase